MSDIVHFAETDFRGQHNTFGIRHSDRRNHMYLVGKTGTGKSTLLKNLIIQDIRAGRGVGVIDPHGDLVEDILNHIPGHRTGETIYFNPSDQDFPIGFNILESVEPHLKTLTASQLISVFKNIWKDFWGPRLEYILSNTLYALLDYESSTLLSIPRILEDKEFRAKVVQKCQDPVVKNFWLNEYEQYGQSFRQEAIAPIQNKVGQFLTSPLIRNILGQVKSKVDMGFVMDNQRILLCNLAKGKIGEDKTHLLGSLLSTKIFLAAIKRADRPEAQRKDFYLYIDECQNLATNVLSSILSEARKYRLNLIITHQYLDQLSEEIKQGVLGNVGTLICFRLGSSDAYHLEKEFSPEINLQDLENLGKYQIYLKLMVDGLTTRPFSARTLPAITPQPNENNKENIIRASRERYGTRREIVEEKIRRWFENSIQFRT